MFFISKKPTRTDERIRRGRKTRGKTDMAMPEAPPRTAGISDGKSIRGVYGDAVSTEETFMPLYCLPARR